LRNHPLSTWSESERDKSRTNYSLGRDRLVIIDEISLRNMKFKRYINTFDAMEETQKKYGGISLLSLW
jgi:hypothetical protein